jgi:hypothetical protein
MVSCPVVASGVLAQAAGFPLTVAELMGARVENWVLNGVSVSVAAVAVCGPVFLTW